MCSNIFICIRKTDLFATNNQIIFRKENIFNQSYTNYCGSLIWKIVNYTIPDIYSFRQFVLAY